MKIAFLIEGLKALPEAGEYAFDPLPEVGYMYQMAKLNSCPSFDPISSFNKEILVRAFSKISPIKHERLFHFILDIFRESYGPDCNDNLTLKQFIMPAYDEWRASQSSPEYPGWLIEMQKASSAERENLKNKMNERIYTAKKGYLKPIDGYKKEKISIHEWLHKLSKKISLNALTEYLQKNSTITHVIGLVSNNLIDLADHCGEVSVVNSLPLSKCRQANLRINNRDINIVIFAGDQGDLLSYNLLSNYVKTLGLKVPKIMPVGSVYAHPASPRSDLVFDLLRQFGKAEVSPRGNNEGKEYKKEHKKVNMKMNS